MMPLPTICGCLEIAPTWVYNDADCWCAGLRQRHKADSSIASKSVARIKLKRLRVRRAHKNRAIAFFRPDYLQYRVAVVRPNERGEAPFLAYASTDRTGCTMV